MEFSINDASLIRLQWSESSHHLASFCQRMLENDLLFDVEITCDSSSLNAHKLVLAANSPFFESLIVDNSCKTQAIIIYGIPFEDLKAIVNFMYFGEVTVPQTQVKSLLNTAKELQVKILKDLVVSEPKTVTENQVLVKNGESDNNRRSDQHFKESVKNSKSIESKSFEDVTLKEEQSEENNKSIGSYSTNDVTYEVSSPNSSAAEQIRREMESCQSDSSDEDNDEQELLKYSHKAIRNFNVFTNEPKTSVIWKYFGKLIFSDPDSGVVSYVDESRHYCSLCVVDCKNVFSMKMFADCNVRCFERGTKEELYMQHLNKAHLIEII